MLKIFLAFYLKLYQIYKKSRKMSQKLPIYFSPILPKCKHFISQRFQNQEVLLLQYCYSIYRLHFYIFHCLPDVLFLTQVPI